MAAEADVPSTTSPTDAPVVLAYGETDVPGLLADSVADRYAAEELERRRAQTERSIASAQEQAAT